MLSRPQFRNIARFFAYGECLECRAAILTSKKAIADFYEDVIPYVLLAFKDPNKEEDINPDDDKNVEKRMWKFAFVQQHKYVEGLDEKFPEKKALEKIDPLVKKIASRGQMEDLSFEDIEKMYQAIVEIDKMPCDFAFKLSALSISENYDFTIPDINLIAEQLQVLLEHINQSVNLYKKALKIVQETVLLEDTNFSEPYPIKAIASIMIFVSHIGRGMCYFYMWANNTSDEKSLNAARDEIHDSLRHLRRCAMDVSKMTVDLINSYRNSFANIHSLSGDFWLKAIDARRAEHDRHGINERLNKYMDLYPEIEKYLNTIGNTSR